MVVGKMRGGGDLVVGGGDGGVYSNTKKKEELNWKEREAMEGRFADDVKMSGGRESPDVAGYGRQAPPPYKSGPWESLGEQDVKGDVKYRD
jgi:spartin